MKIIGECPGGFLIQATTREVANLAGFYYEGEMGAQKALQPGAEIDVSALYHHRRSMDESEKDRTALATRLRAAADVIDTTMPKPTQPTEEAQQ